MNDISHFRIVMNDDLNCHDLPRDLSSDVMNIFAQIGENGKEVPNTQFSSMPQISSVLNPDKRSSDPSVLKTLRMFRPHNTKNSPRGHLPQMLHNRNKETPSSRGENEVAYADRKSVV